MSCQPHAGRAGVGEEHCVVGGEVAQGGGQELGTEGFEGRPFHDVVLQELVERFRFGEALVEKAVAGLVADATKQGGDGGLDVANEPEVDVGTAADVFRIFVDLDFFYAVAGEEFREGKVGAEQQQ